jgi:hypothetical protein
MPPLSPKDRLAIRLLRAIAYLFGHSKQFEEELERSAKLSEAECRAEMLKKLEEISVRLKRDS